MSRLLVLKDLVQKLKEDTVEPKQSGQLSDLLVPFCVCGSFWEMPTDKESVLQRKAAEP